MISIVSTNFRMSGGYINHLDTYDFLRNYYVKYYYMEETPLWEMLLKTDRNYNLKNPIRINDSMTIEDDIIITDFRGLIVLHNHKIFLICKKLIVMDCMELTFHLNEIYDAIDWFFWFDFSYRDLIYKYLTYIIFKEIIFLMPESNHKKFIKKYPDLRSKIFYKKINKRVLLKNRSLYYFDKDVFLYKRKEEKQYYDQFGRTIFEFLMLGKKVIFENDPFMRDDGLSDYLKYYEVIEKPDSLIERMNDDGYLQSELLL